MFGNFMNTNPLCIDPEGMSDAETQSETEVESRRGRRGVQMAYLNCLRTRGARSSWHTAILDRKLERECESVHLMKQGKIPSEVLPFDFEEWRRENNVFSFSTAFCDYKCTRTPANTHGIPTTVPRDGRVMPVPWYCCQAHNLALYPFPESVFMSFSEGSLGPCELQRVIMPHETDKVQSFADGLHNSAALDGVSAYRGVSTGAAIVRRLLDGHGPQVSIILGYLSDTERMWLGSTYQEDGGRAALWSTKDRAWLLRSRAMFFLTKFTMQHGVFLVKTSLWIREMMQASALAKHPNATSVDTDLDAVRDAFKYQPWENVMCPMSCPVRRRHFITLMEKQINPRNVYAALTKLFVDHEDGPEGIDIFLDMADSLRREFDVVPYRRRDQWNF
jgi:hypothetical protein